MKLKNIRRNRNGHKSSKTSARIDLKNFKEDDQKREEIKNHLKELKSELKESKEIVAPPLLNGSQGQLTKQRNFDGLIKEM